MGLVVTDGWFRAVGLGDGITRIDEPRVHPLLRANIWHVRGRDRDLVVDSGLGVASLRGHVPALFEHHPVLVVTHAHLDHLGGAHEFADCRGHADEPMANPHPGSLHLAPLAAELGLDPALLGDALPDLLLTVLPRPGYDPGRYRLRPAPPTCLLADGDHVELGDRAFRVLHLPGHTAGSIGLLDESSGVLFPGDVVYDDVLLDELTGSSISDYLTTMERLHDLPVRVVHPGHGDSFGADVLRRIAADYLAKRTAAPAMTATASTTASAIAQAGTLIACAAPVASRPAGRGPNLAASRE
jgi:glyoxylase-like metal-dependent hydrolase (beta-lactamase superfamily II)